MQVVRAPCKILQRQCKKITGGGQAEERGGGRESREMRRRGGGRDACYRGEYRAYPLGISNLLVPASEKRAKNPSTRFDPCLF